MNINGHLACVVEHYTQTHTHLVVDVFIKPLKSMTPADSAVLIIPLMGEKVI